MTDLHLAKLHATGNDFLVLARARRRPSRALDAATVAALCDRHRGIGADGLHHDRARAPTAPTAR